MRFLLDQDVPDIIARVIEGAGHQVSRLREKLSVESTDEEVLAFAHSEGGPVIVMIFSRLQNSNRTPALSFWFEGKPESLNAAIFSASCNPLEKWDCETTLTLRNI